MCKAKHFNLGLVTLSSGIVSEKLVNKRFAKSVDSAMRRFYKKDWGEATKDRKKQNAENLSRSYDPYLLGVYKTCKGNIWIIGNKNPVDNVTTILFPNEF